MDLTGTPVETTNMRRARDQILELRGEFNFPKFYDELNIAEPYASPDLRPATAIYMTSKVERLNSYEGIPALYRMDLGVADETICLNCRHHGTFEFINGNKFCISGCLTCVRANNWKWGKTSDSVNEDTFDIPCNGSYMGRELSNIELIYEMMNHVECFYHIDFDTLFDQTPKRIHPLMRILWKDLNLKNNEREWTIAKHLVEIELSTEFTEIINKWKPKRKIKQQSVQWFIERFNRVYPAKPFRPNLSWDPSEDPVPKLPKKILCRKLMESIEDNQEKLTEGEYLKMMNLVRDIHLTQC